MFICVEGFFNFLVLFFSNLNIFFYKGERERGIFCKVNNIELIVWWVVNVFF